MLNQQQQQSAQPKPQDNTCPQCQAAQPIKIWDGPVRDGNAQHTRFSEAHTVRQCRRCQLVFLHPFPTAVSTQYQDGSYWQQHKRIYDRAKQEQTYGREQDRWIQVVGKDAVRNKDVLDIGAGAGLFLDRVKSTAVTTAGIEPDPHWCNVLQTAGHHAYNNSNNVPDQQYDVAVSFDTLEHVPRPSQFLQEIHRLLRPSGTVCLGVPNNNDFLKQLVPAYLPFFYHTSHLYYFTDQTLGALLTQTGFTNLNVQYVHKYDLMNCILWVRDSKGHGVVGSDLFDTKTERNWRDNLERQGIASHLFIRATKA